MSHIVDLIFSRTKMTTLRKVPTFDEMMWPTLLALKQMGGSASNQELLTCVMKLMAIPEEVQNLLHGAGPKSEIEYRMLWTRTYLHKVGAIQNSERGVWSITPAGNALTEDEVKNIVAQVRAMDRKLGSNSEPASADQLEEEEPAERCAVPRKSTRPLAGTAHRSRVRGRKDWPPVLTECAGAPEQNQHRVKWPLALRRQQRQHEQKAAASTCAA
jgi:Mrr N-terminal domain